MAQEPNHGTITIGHLRDEDEGQYQCFAENQYGTATSNSVFVRKSTFNAFKDVPVNTLDVNEGDPFEMKCESPGGFPNPKLYWIRQNIYGGMENIKDPRITQNADGNVYFSNVTRDDKSDDFYYACTAVSIFRSEYKVGLRIILNVIQMGTSPSQNRIQTTLQYVTPKNTVALRGKKIELYCIYGGTPLPQVIWSKDGKALNWDDRVKQNNFGKSIIIQNVTFDDVGTYTCEASNGIGSAQSHSIQLEVQSKPYFTVEPKVQNAAEGESVEFECEASGVPEPEIKWIFNGEPIEQTPSNARRSNEKNKIIIRDVKANDTGNYGCNATNPLGHVYKDVYLNVSD